MILMVWSTFLMQQDGCERGGAQPLLSPASIFTFRYSSVCATFMYTCFKHATIFFQPVHPHSNVSSIKKIAWNNEPSPKAFGVAITDFRCFRNACAANPQSSPTSTAMTTAMGSTGDHNKMKLNLSAPESYKERKIIKSTKK